MLAEKLPAWNTAYHQVGHGIECVHQQWEAFKYKLDHMEAIKKKTKKNDNKTHFCPRFDFKWVKLILWKKKKLVCLCEFLKGHFLQRDCAASLNINLTINVKSTPTLPYREVVSTGDCTSILPVMCLGVMAGKKTPKKRTWQEHKKPIYLLID